MLSASCVLIFSLGYARLRSLNLIARDCTREQQPLSPYSLEFGRVGSQLQLRPAPLAVRVGIMRYVIRPVCGTIFRGTSASGISLR